MSEPVKLAIIGTAGRDRSIAALMTSDLWRKMCERAMRAVDTLKPVELISGGVAWVDHTAVHCHLETKIPLTIWGPCDWDAAATAWDDNGKKHWSVNPGKVANRYHHRFSKQAGIDSLDQLQQIHDSCIYCTTSCWFSSA